MILAVRTIAKGEAAAKSIRESTGATSTIIESWELDLASYSSVTAFASRVATLDRLDVVVENAGMLATKFTMAEDNERTITVNFTSTMLLALLLLPKLRETSVELGKDVVLTFTGSFVHWLTDFPERKARSILAATADEATTKIGSRSGAGKLLLDEAGWTDTGNRYATSKLMELLAVRELANQVTKSDKLGNIIVSYLNPGSVRSELNREFTGAIAAIRGYAFRKILARKTEEGSRTLVWAAAGGGDTHGQYLDDCQVAE